MKLNKIFKTKNIPNFLTIFRIIVSIVIVILLILAAQVVSNSYFNYFYLFSISSYQYLGYWIGAASLFLIAIITDWIDGHIARRFNYESMFGKFLDPLADKILVNLTSLILVIFYGSMFPYWVLIIFLFRDYLVDGLRFVLVKNYNITLAAAFLGKIKTCLQMIAILFILFLMPFFAGNIVAIQLLLLPLYLAAIISIVSAIYYLIYFYEVINNVKILPNNKIPEKTKNAKK